MLKEKSDDLKESENTQGTLRKPIDLEVHEKTQDIRKTLDN